MTPAAYLDTAETAIKLNQKYFAALASLAYDFALLKKIKGLKFLQRAPQKNGYDAAVYFHAASKALIFVNRGTDGFRSFTDWFEGAAAAIAERFQGPLTGSVAFVLDTVSKLSAAGGIDGTRIGAVGEIWCTGHSWGGACAEAQVALTQALAEKQGMPVTLNVCGVGFASAGFADAIRAYAASQSVRIEDDMHWLMNHFIRSTDPILLQPNRELLGEAYQIPGIYVTATVPSANGRNFEFGINAPLLLNHDSKLYFEQFEFRGATHIFRKSNGQFLLCDGVVPPKLSFGTVAPSSVIVGVPI